MHSVNPLGRPQDYKTYQILAPKSTHFRDATCAEVECVNYQRGWKTVIDTSSELGQRQAYYIEKQSGRSYKKEVNEAGLTEYVFAAGQACFKQHSVRLENVPDMFLVKDGDWRKATNVRRHQNADDWVDDFKNHQDKLRETRERG